MSEKISIFYAYSHKDEALRQKLETHLAPCEVAEETGAKLGQLHILGYQRLRLLTPKPIEYRHPYPVSYQVFYWASVTSLENFEPTRETYERSLFAPDQAQTIAWVQRHRGLYQAALAAVTHIPQF